MKDYEKFFSNMEDYRIESRFYENGASFEIEELYQAFKQRLMDEIMVSNPDTRTHGLLIDNIITQE